MSIEKLPSLPKGGMANYGSSGISQEAKEMKLVSILMLLLSQAAMADATTKQPKPDNCPGATCPARQDGSAVDSQSKPADARAPLKKGKESPKPTSGSGGEPPGALFKNVPPTAPKSAPE
ncbi:MAG TPA: hypothetical protein PLU47_03780 [Azonexus sp.]|nr:hypothetical protein [Azonexus sp.]